VRIFLAGGSGVIGRPLIRQLKQAGHEVVATTRTPKKAEQLSLLGATPVVLDALDGDAVETAVREAAPEAIIHQLTALPQTYQPTKPAFYETTNRLRTETTHHLLAAGRQVGARRFVFQSICFLYKLRGPTVLDETAPVSDDAPEPFGGAVRHALEGERLAQATPDVEGVVLRYGQLYGPGTYYSHDGDFGRRARRRMLPIVGAGTGVSSFLHVEDAASAAVAALTRGSGVYNVADDEPAAASDWIPVFCDSVGAPSPWHAPTFLAKLVAGSMVVANLVHGRGASSAKAKAELGWSPAKPTWRTGFYEMTAGTSGSPAAR